MRDLAVQVPGNISSRTAAAEMALSLGYFHAVNLRTKLNRVKN